MSGPCFTLSAALCYVPRDGSFVINPELLQSIDDSCDLEAPAADPDNNSSSDTDENILDPEELDTVDLDWERVPSTLPETEVPTRLAEPCHYQSAYRGVQSRPRSATLPDTRTTQSLAGALMSSATSLWRGFTGGGKS